MFNEDGYFELNILMSLMPSHEVGRRPAQFDAHVALSDIPLASCPLLRIMEKNPHHPLRSGPLATTGKIPRSRLPFSAAFALIWR